LVAYVGKVGHGRQQTLDFHIMILIERRGHNSRSWEQYYGVEVAVAQYCIRIWGRKVWYGMLAVGKFESGRIWLRNQYFVLSYAYSAHSMRCHMCLLRKYSH
jgi:hypothetical protein